MLRVLAVDDNASVRSALERCVEPLGFEVEHAENGAVALRMLKQREYDLVFLDLYMPVLDGPSMLRILRAQGAKLPVVLVTSAAERAVVGEAFKLGSSDYLAKPFTTESVVETVARALQLDPAQLAPPPPRVMVLDPDALAGPQLRAVLPERVLVDEATSVEQALELARANAYDALVVDGDAGLQPAELEPLWRAQPAAGRFVTGPEVAPGFDAAVAPPAEEKPVRRTVYETCLRPIALTRGNTITLAAVRGADPEVFFAVGARRVLAHARALASSVLQLRIDLTRAPPGRALTRLVLDVREDLEELGLDPTFVVSEPARVELVQVPALARTAFQKG
jgi:CheY-like chemotaxis protein